VSLSGVKKRTVGRHGREAPTGITDFKSWDAFEQEVSFIWKNARTYNEDGSDMYNLAGELEVCLSYTCWRYARLTCTGTFHQTPSGSKSHCGGAIWTSTEAECQTKTYITPWSQGISCAFLDTCCFSRRQCFGAPETGHLCRRERTSNTASHPK